MLRALVGPTACGKTEAGIALAARLDAEVLSIDSMLVYRGMDVGTAKPTPEQRRGVPHHLMDVVDPSERFTVAMFQDLAADVLQSVERPLLVGGSGLYFRAVVDDLRFPREDAATRVELEREAALVGAGAMHRRLTRTDPVAAARIDPGNVRRTVRALEVTAVTGRPFSEFAVAWERFDPGRVRAAGIRMERAALGRRIEGRVRAMVDAGWLGEVDELCARGLGAWLTSSRAIGYAELARHLDREMSLEAAIDATVRRTRELARRQMAWFRRDPRIAWFDAGAGGATEVLDDLHGYLAAAS
jgi:tRNA dimethylallyltransferase